MGVPTGGNLGAATGSIHIDTTQAQQAPQVMAGVASGVERSMARVDSSAKQAEKGIGGLRTKFDELDSAIGASFLVAGITQLTRITFELAKASAQAEVTRDSFASLAAGVGQDADELLAAMQRVSHGTISESNLILGANRAIISGVADNTKELTQILEIARATGRAFGVDTTEAYSRIVRAVSKLEPELLDELGITLRLDSVYRTYAASLGTTADKLTDVQRRQAMYNEVVRQSQPAVDAARKAGKTAADTYDQVGSSFDDAKKAAGDLLNTMGAGLWATVFIASTKAVQAEMARLVSWIEAVQGAWNGLTNLLGMGVGGSTSSGGVPAWMTGVSPSASGPLGPALDQKAIDKVKLDWAEAVSDVSEQMRADIVDAERELGRQRADAIEDYQKNIVREAEDFATQRQRQEQELADSIADIHEDAARREVRAAEDLARNIGRMQSDSAERIADMARDRDERIAEAREDSQERLVEMEEDYNEAREKAAENHRLKLLEAAGRLDAKAIYLEQQRFKQQEEDAKESYDEQRSDVKDKLAEQLEDINKSYQERLADEQEALAKSIAQANEAHQRQLADARAADAQRIADMQEDFAKRTAQEDADRATRLQRMAEDHQDQLAEMDRAHALRLAQINIHAQNERDELDKEAETALLDLKGRNAAQEAEKKRHEEYLESLWDKYMGHIEGTLTPGHPSEADPYDTPANQERAALMRERDDIMRQMESPLPPSEWVRLNARLQELNELLGPALATVSAVLSSNAISAIGAASVPPIAATSALGFGGNRSVTLGDVHVSVAGTNASALDIAGAVRQEVARLLVEVAG